MSLRETLRQYFQMYGGRTLVVAVSGGADSLALLHGLTTRRDELDLTLHVATLDHGIRGEAGAADAEYVRQLAQAWGVACTVGRVDVPKLAQEWKVGIEAAARRARYDFLARVCHELNTSYVVTAHNANDQVETILMHIIRGSGTRGLAGMESAAMPYHSTIRLARPLLNVTRAEIDAYCAEHGIIPRHDETNDDTRYTRNRIRHEVLPLLRQINPQVDAALLRLSEIARIDDWALQQRLYREINAAGDRVVRDGKRYLINRDWITQLDTALAQRMFPWVSAFLQCESPTYERVQAALNAATTGVVGTSIELGNRLTFTIDYTNFIIARDDAAPLNINWGVEGVITVAVPGVTEFGDYRLTTSLEPLEPTHARLSIPLNATVTLRQRQNGDRFAPLGLNGHTQKVAEWMVDHKVPAAQRSTIPLLIVNGEIAAICWDDLWAISESYRVKDDSERVIYIQLMKFS